MKSARRRSRELAMRALYQWGVTGYNTPLILKQFTEDPLYVKADKAYFEKLFRGVLDEIGKIDSALEPHLDRPLAELSPIELAILRVGGYELGYLIDVPYRVVINEAVELAKEYGGTDGFKYVNGVLDKLAQVTRAIEVSANSRRPASE